MILLASPEKPLSASDLWITSMRIEVSCVSRGKALDTEAMLEDCPFEAIGLNDLSKVAKAADTSSALFTLEQ